MLPGSLSVGATGLGGEEVDGTTTTPRPKTVQGCMLCYVDMLPVIQPRSPHSLVVSLESERMYEMKCGSNTKAQSANISGVWSDLRLHQCNVHDRFHNQPSVSSSFPIITRAGFNSLEPTRYPTLNTSSTNPSCSGDVTGITLMAS
jgi:hypothetical protein